MTMPRPFAPVLVLFSAVLLPLRAGALPACLGPGADCALREIAAEAGVFVGAATEPFPILSEPSHGATLAGEFNSLTPENRMKWPFVHPEPDRFSFANADLLVDFAEQHGMRVRGHTLLWSRELPAYVEQAATADELRGYLREHVDTLVGRYAGRVAQWDVVNEPLPLPGSPGDLQTNVFTELIGPGYIAEAFRLAHAADPSAELFLNEVFVEYRFPRFDAFYALVRSLLEAGVPIHGVGLQAHFTYFPPLVEQLRANIEALAALGLAVEITELDISLLLFTGTEEERLEAQRLAYLDVMSACLAVPACRGITTWGVDDGHSWLRRVVGPDARPLLFDEAYLRKPAYYGARDALAARLASVPEPGTAALALAGLLALALRRARPGPEPSRPRVRPRPVVRIPLATARAGR